MKNIKVFAFTISLLCAFHSYGMKRASSERIISAKAEFIPADNITRSLFAILHQANRQVLIAMYWFTDDFILNRLLELKKQGVTIKIIFDESSQSRDDMLYKLLSHSITPVIFPSDTQGIGKMHNKYLVIDENIVLTGSANFTQQAFKPTNATFNYENTLTIYSDELAQRYQTNFRNIEAAAFDLYIDIVANNTNLPMWMKRLLPILFSENEQFRQIQQFKMPQMNTTQQNRIRTFFGLPVEPSQYRAATPISPYQASFLRNYLSPEQLEGMTYDEAYDLVGKILHGK